MNLLLVCPGGSIFMLDFVKALKKSIDINVYIFNFGVASINDNTPYESTYYTKFYKSILNVKYIGRLIMPFYMRYELYKYLKKTKVKFDIINFHYMISPWVLFPKGYKKYGSNIVTTFWGSELEEQRILYVSKLYKFFLIRYLNHVKKIVTFTKDAQNDLICLNKDISTKFYTAEFGSTPLEHILKCVKSEEKKTSKERIGFDTERATVVIGYSGKELHNHLQVVQSLKNSKEYDFLKDKIELIAPMTYGCGKEYIDRVKIELEKSGFKYTLISGRFLSEEEIARLRNSTDIVIQMSKSDAASYSIKEAMLSRSVLISAKWLRYQYFKDEGFKFIEINEFSELPGTLKYILDNYNCKEIVDLRNERIDAQKYFWNNQIVDWVKLYQNISN